MSGFNVVRCSEFVHAVQQAEAPPDIDDQVLVLVSVYGLTRADFVELDEHPGHFPCFGRGYRADGINWHQRLRRVRNADNDLFERLAANDEGG